MTGQGRVAAIDVLRGVSLFGIFQMNVQLFAFPLAGYMRPPLVTPLHGLDLAAWLFTHVICEFKFITVFSMLFGAGIVLAKPDNRTFWSRQGWLLFFGLLHAYFVWFGDILVIYAIGGAFMWKARFWPSAKQARYGVALFCAPLVLVPALELSVALLPAEMQKMMLEGFSPTPVMLAREVAINRGPWLQQLLFRFGQTSEGELFACLLHVWRAAGGMAIGASLTTSGVLLGQRPELETKLVKWGLGIGTPLMLTSAALLLAFDFPPSSGMSLGLVSYVASLPMGLGFLGLGLKAVRCWSGPVLRALAAAGRMSLTHYLSQSLIASVIFYGFGFGLHGQLARWQLIPLAAAIWAVQVASSPMLERVFGRGPFERAWRALVRLTSTPRHA